MRPTRGRSGLAIALATTLLCAAPLWAQQTGTIQGEVRSDQTNEPLASVQVSVQGTQLGTLTNEQGRFLLTGVPAGTHVVRVDLIGYRSQTRSVTVQPNGTAAVEFSLSASAVALDEIVVTGQGREMRRREVGTSLATVSADQLEAAPISSMSEMLQGRAAGVNVLPGGGQVGQGTKVVLRGVSSFSQGIDPIIYVDGVRMDNSTAMGVWTGGVGWSGLDDINPADVERIEIVRGAAAATLYGTEASAGVIQIFTKRGREGARGAWTYRGEYGVSDTPADWWNVSLYSPWFHQNYIDTAPLTEHQLSVSGGLEGFSYYASGTYRGAEGVMKNNAEDYYAFRGNMQLFPRNDLVVRLQTGYSRRDVAFPQDANNIYGYGINALTAGSRGLFMPIDEIELIEVGAKSDRFTGGLTLEYTPFERFTNRLTAGADIVTYDNTEFQPYGGNSFNPQGRKDNYRRDATTLSLDYSGSFTHAFGPDITTATTAGFQAYEKKLGAANAWGERFPAPGLSVVGSAAVTSGWEFRQRTRSAGFFLQEQIGLYDRLFVTGGVRLDAHSAFGEDYPYQIYPKIALSYVLSEHGFVPRLFDNLRVRAAFGTAGRQPGAFDSERTWDPVQALEGVAAVEPENLGNPDLAPEVSHEYEAGLDLSVFEGRLGFEGTYFFQRTHGALLPVREPPSLGFLSTQLRNVGEIQNRGVELSTTVSILRLDNVRWDAGANATFTRNEITDLGELPELYVHWTQAHREGFPAGSFFDDRYMLDDNGEVILAEDDPSLGKDNPGYIGPPFPTRTFQLSTNATFFDRLHFRALLDHSGGHYVESSTFRWITRLRVPEDDEVVAEELWGTSPAAWCHEGHASYSDPVMQAYCETPWGRGGPRGNVVLPADYWKLRELTLTYDVPARFSSGLGFNRASVYFSGRNIWRSQSPLLMEAESNYNTSGDLSAQEYFSTPIPRQFMLGVRVGF